MRNLFHQEAYMHGLNLETIGSRYRLDRMIGSGGMGTVYRATDRLTGHTVALKRVRTPLGDLAFSSKGKGDNQVALIKEFRTLSSLRHPYIIDVLDYGFDEQRNPFFTMELLEGGVPIRAYSTFAQPEKILERIIEILQVLMYLHRRKILHRDLKPSNIMVIDDHIKVLDFGLAKSVEARSSEYSKDNIAGTMAYMAPELFKGEKVSVSTDLYAVGLVAYELLTREFPFKGNNLAHLAYEILNTSPDLMLLSHLPDMAIDVIDRLLTKDPRHRYQDAGEALYDLRRALNQKTGEGVEIRESFLQAANFVGRDQELSTLSQALENVINDVGSAWLVGGESGVGKTRLLDELRIQALVRGVLVLRGQVPAERHEVFQSWRDIVRHLCLEVDLADLDAQVLKVLVPDIERLIERPVDDAPTLPPQAALERLLQTLEGLFRKLDRPVIVILEDLHWAREGLSILKHLSNLVEDLPIFLIGSYRNDARPNLPEELSTMRVLPLNRLDHDAIRALSVSMIGAMGEQENVVDMLERETEGNALFIVEVMRTLAEDAGRFDDIGRMTLPERVFSEGIQTVIQRRLANLPEHALLPLQLAAIAGRRIDLTILQYALSDYDWDLWLVICSDAAIISADGYAWEFAHDKLRDSILNSLLDVEKKELSAHIAASIEAVYPDKDGYAPMLANHWHNAENYANELHYTWTAAKQLYAVSNIHAMRQYLERALTLAQTETIPDILRWQMEIRMAEAHALMSDIPLAIDMLEDLMTRMGDHHDPELACVKADAQYQWAFSLMSYGEYERAQAVAKDGLDIVEWCDDRSQQARILWIVGMTQLFGSHTRVAKDYFQRCLTLAEQINDTAFIMSAYIGLGSVAYMQEQFTEGIEYSQRAYDLALETGNVLFQEYALHNQGAFYVAAGETEAGLKYLEEAKTLAERLNLLPALALARINIATAYVMQDNLELALDMLQQGLDLAMAVETTPTALLGIGTFAYWLVKQDYRAEAATLFAYVLNHPKTQIDDRVIFSQMIRDYAISGDEMASAAVHAKALDFEGIIGQIMNHSGV